MRGLTLEIDEVDEREKDHETDKSCSSGRFFGASCGRTGVGSGLAWPDAQAKQMSLDGTMPKKRNQKTGKMEDNQWNKFAQKDDLTISQTGAKAIRPRKFFSVKVADDFF